MRTKNDNKCSKDILTMRKMQKNTIDYLHHMRNNDNMVVTTVSKAIEQNESVQYVTSTATGNNKDLVKNDASVESTNKPECNQVLVEETRRMQSVTTASIKTTNARSGIDIHVHFGGNCTNNTSSTTKKFIPRRCIQEIPPQPQSRGKVKKEIDDSKKEKRTSKRKKWRKTNNATTNRSQQLGTLPASKKFKKFHENDEIHFENPQSASEFKVDEMLIPYIEKVPTKRQTKKQSLKGNANTNVSKNDSMKKEKKKFLKIFTQTQLNRLNNLNKTSLEVSLKYILNQLSEISSAKGLQLKYWSMLQQTIKKIDQTTQTVMGKMQKFEHIKTEDDDDCRLVIDESFLGHTLMSKKVSTIRNNHEDLHKSAKLSSTVEHIHQQLNEIEHRLISMNNKKSLTQKDKEEFFMLLDSLHKIEEQSGEMNLLNNKSLQSFNDKRILCKKDEPSTTSSTIKAISMNTTEVDDKSEGNAPAKGKNTKTKINNQDEVDKKLELIIESNELSISENKNPITTSQQNDVIGNVLDGNDNQDSSPCIQAFNVKSPPCNVVKSDFNCITQTNEHDSAAANDKSTLTDPAAVSQLTVTTSNFTVESVKKENSSDSIRTTQDKETIQADSTTYSPDKTTNSDLCQHVESSTEAINNNSNNNSGNEEHIERIESLCNSKSLADSESLLNYSALLSKDYYSSPNEDDWSTSTDESPSTKSRQDRSSSSSSSQEIDEIEKELSRTFMNESKRSKLQYSALKGKSTFVYKQKPYDNYNSDSTENWHTDESRDGEDVKGDENLLQSVADSLNHDIRNAHKHDTHSKEKQIKFDIASPDVSPKFDELSSPVNRPKINLNNYPRATGINACMDPENIIYFLYEIDVPQFKVNVPRSFDCLNINVMDPRLLKYRNLNTPTSAIVKHSPVSPLNDPRLRLLSASPKQQTPNMLLYSCLQRSSWYQELMSTMKIQINQSISELVRALNHFQRKRLLDPTIVFDVFKIDCAGELLEIMKNLNVFIDGNGRIVEKNYRVANAPITSLESAFMQQIMPASSQLVTEVFYPTAVTASATTTTTTVRHACQSTKSTHQRMPTASFVSCYIDQPTLSTSPLNGERSSNSQKHSSSFHASSISQRAAIKSTPNEKFRHDSERDMSGEETVNFSRYRAPYDRHRRDRFQNNSNWRDRRYQQGGSYRRHYRNE